MIEMTPACGKRCLTNLEALADVTKTRWSDALADKYKRIIQEYPDSVAEPVVDRIVNSGTRMPMFADLRQMLEDEMPKPPLMERLGHRPEAEVNPQEARRLLRQGIVRAFREQHPDMDIDEDEIMGRIGNSGPGKALEALLSGITEQTDG